MAGLGQGMNAMKSMGGNWKRPVAYRGRRRQRDPRDRRDSRPHRDRRRCHSHRRCHSRHKGR